MLKHRVAPVLALLLSLFMQSAHAFFDPPYITPANPTAGQPVSVNIHGGECDGIIGMPGYPQITQNGNAIRILFLSVHYDDPTFCNIGVGTATQIVGTYAPGDYTLQVDHHEPGGLPQTLGVIPFTVTGTLAPPIQAPTLNGFGLALLVACLLGITAWTLRSRASYLLLIALTCLSPNLRAQETRESGRMIEVLLTTSPGAPTAKPTFNPLFEKASLRSVLASTTAQAQANQPWSATQGYGRPDAAAAARKMLGKVARATIRNRVTPLFRLYSSGTNDYVDTTSPQTALAFPRNSVGLSTYTS